MPHIKNPHGIIVCVTRDEYRKLQMRNPEGVDENGRVFRQGFRAPTTCELSAWEGREQEATEERQRRIVQLAQADQPTVIIQQILSSADQAEKTVKAAKFTSK